MSRQLFSPSWHTVAELAPRLAPQASVSRHVYRGRVWFVLHDLASGRTHRINPAAQALISRFDGARTIDELWRDANPTDTQDTLTQAEVIELLVALHNADLLITNTTPDAAALFKRHQTRRRQPWVQWLMNPMSLKLPLWNPDPFLTRTLPAYRWLFSRWGLMAYLALVLPALMLFAQHASTLTHNLTDTALSAGNLLTLALVFPVVKLLHELGHGMATRVWGGPVPQMGLMFLVFAPVPYVDASAASAFASKGRRALVGAAGMLTEILLAALAVYVWVLAEPGLVRAIAFNVVLIAGVSTVLVNGNPLLRFDGYYILCDLIEMPNLAERGRKYWTWLTDRKLFGAHDATPPHEQPGERAWLLAYTPLAWVYRCLVMVGIILIVAGEYFIFGTLLAIWGMATLIGVPLWKSWRHLTRSPTLARHRGRAIKTTLALTGFVAAIVLFAPVPLRTLAEGVVWLPDDAIVRAGESGFLKQWHTPPGQTVSPGTPLFVLHDPAIEAELALARARESQARAEFYLKQFKEPAAAEIARDAWAREQAVLARAEQKFARMTGLSLARGTFVTDAAQDKPGRYFKKGDIIGYVLEPANLLARVIVTQDDVGLMRNALTGVQLKPAENLTRSFDSTLLRAYPGGTQELPSAALALTNGGPIATAVDDHTGTKALNRVFAYDFAIPPAAQPLRFGERVYVRLDHGYEPLAMQATRRLRQLFLSHFKV